MNVFYTDEQVSGRSFALHILHSRFHLVAPRIERGENGKPRLADDALFFNLSHSRGRTFLAVGEEEVGLDAEWRSRRLPAHYLRHLREEERGEDFFRLWTAKEAYVKYRGGTLARMLPRLCYAEGVLTERGAPVDARLAFLDADGFTIALCSASPQRIELIHG